MRIAFALFPIINCNDNCRNQISKWDFHGSYEFKKIVFFSSRTAFPLFFLISFCPDLIFTNNYESHLSKYESSVIECCRFISSLFFFYGHLVMLMWFLTSHRNETRGRNTPESVSINQHSIFVLSLKLSSVKSGIIYNITDDLQ